MTLSYSLYFHIPFCTHRCAYCDFNTYAGQEAMIPAYVDALCKEIQFVGARFNSSPGIEDRGDGKVHTIFFGGGTPSLLSPKQFEAIFKSIRDNFILTDDPEITIEANPGTVSYENLLELRRVGVNRISYGVQSANTEELRMLERAHNFLDVIEAFTSARKAGFDRHSNGVNLDLIYGLPEQTLSTWQTTVKRILDLHPEHISAYALALEHGTPFGRWSSKGLLPLPDPDLAADMYEWASETLEANGYIQYEISNWAKDLGSNGAEQIQNLNQNPFFACRHNLQYWHSLPYFAFGAGAHGYVNGYRYSNVLRIKSYIDRMTDYQISSSLVSNLQFPLTPATVNHHKQALTDDMSEYMLNNLRLVKTGASDAEFKSRFGSGLMDIYAVEVEELIRFGLLEWGGNSIKLTKRGRLLGNQVFMRFV